MTATAKPLPKLSWKPRKADVLALPDPPETKTAGGLHRAESFAAKSFRGTIVAVGPDVSPDVRPGTRALWSDYTGGDVDVDGVTYRLLKDEHVRLVEEV